DVVDDEEVVDAIERFLAALVVVPRRLGLVARRLGRQPLRHRLGGLLPLGILLRELALGLPLAALFEHALPALVLSWQRRIALDHLHRLAADPALAIELPLALRLHVDVRALALV